MLQAQNLLLDLYKCVRRVCSNVTPCRISWCRLGVEMYLEADVAGARLSVQANRLVGALSGLLDLKLTPFALRI